MEETKIIEEKKKLKILFIGSNPENIGGIETFGRNLKKIYEEKIYFFSYGKNKKSLYNVDTVIKYKKINYYPKFLRKMIQKYMEKKYLKNTIKKINPDVLILNSPQDLKKIKQTKLKKILVQHQTAEKYWIRDSYLNKDLNLLKRVREEIDKVILLSEYDKFEFEEKFELKKTQLESIRHMSHLDLKKEKKNKGKKLIMVCRLDLGHKRIDLALRAMKNLKDYELNIYGNGKDENYLKTLKKELKLENVLFHGATSKVKEKLDENSIFIMTSDYEGYPLTVIESMRRGVPIIVRDTFTSAKDIINNNGILLDKEWDEEEFINSVKKVYNNYEFYSKNSLEQGKRHSFEIIKEKWIKVVEEVLK